MILGLRACVLVIPILAACSPYALDQGDSLRLSFEPGLVFVSAMPRTTIPTSVTSDESCQNAEGAVVHVSGTDINGRFPEEATAIVWLSSATEGQLVPIQELDAEDPSHAEVHVVLDEQGTARACFLPGTAPGSVTVTARSGVVETSNTLTVRDRVVPLDGSLTLTITKPDAYLSAAATAGACGMISEGACSPGRARRAAIALMASAPQSGGDVPEGAEVIVTTDKGWLTPTHDCAAKESASQLILNLKNGAATAHLCLDDTGGTATLTAHSGSVTTTKSVDVPALPSALVLSPSSSSTKAGSSLTLTAHVRGCDGKGISGLPVSMTINQGLMTFETPQNPIQLTNNEGTISVTGTALEGPLTIKASLSTLPDIECATTIEVKP